MIVRVRMSAFNETDIPYRMVTVPNRDWNNYSDEQRLEAVYHHGQNEIQPDPKCQSVSMGDCIEYHEDGGLYLVMAQGFRQISEEQYEKFAALSITERQMKVLFNQLS